MESVPDELHDSLDTLAIFGPFCVEPGKRLLTRDGTPLDIGGRALDLLVALVAQPGKVVSKRELLKQVWPDVVVEEGSLRFHMNSLRRLLGDGVDGARYIATQVGVGYAFVAPVETRTHGSQADNARAPAVSAARPSTSRARQLPPQPRLIGRDDDALRVVERLTQPALFTIVGPGGVGKTSLAIEVAHRIVAGYDGVAFVDLAQIEDPTLVLSAFARALGVPVQAEDPLLVLLAYLRGRRVLLVIDNCEHVVDTVSPLLEKIRDDAPAVTILATSREPLRARGEQLLQLTALDFPANPDELSVKQLLDFAAIRLFVERATASNATLVPDTIDARLVADMCRRLDGMALPIELAAVRAATHGIQATHAMLGERFSLGWSGRRTALPRQQTLRATLDWSYGLLSSTEQLMFDRLAIFVGPFSLRAAAQVTTDAALDEMTAASTLDELAAKGLVAVDHSEAAQSYRLLEMTRAYAREKLAMREADTHALSFRHAAFYVDLLGDLGMSPDEAFSAAARLANQLGNIRSALEWSFGPHGDPGLALPLAAASAPLFLHFSLLIECRTWCSRATELLELGYHGTPAELELQAALGFVLMFTRGNSEAAEKALLRAMHIAVALDDYWSQLRVLGRLQIFYERIGDFASSLAWAEQAIEVGNAIGDAEAVGVAASLAGVSHHLLGNQQLARDELEKALRHSLPSHLSRTVHYGFDHRNRTGLALARTLWLQGFADQARRWADQVEQEAATLGHPVTHCIALVWTLCIYIWTGDLDKAAKSLNTFRDIAETHAFGPYIAASRGMEGAIAIRAGAPGDAVNLLEESLAQLHGMRYELLNTSFEIALAEGLMLGGEHARALAIVERTIAHCRASGDAFALPELLRIKAVTLKALNPGDCAMVTDVLAESLAMSRQQGARAWEWRTSMELARLALEQGRRSEAREVLQGCRNQVSEGFDSLDLRQLDLFWQQISDADE